MSCAKKELLSVARDRLSLMTTDNEVLTVGRCEKEEFFNCQTVVPSGLVIHHSHQQAIKSN